MKLLKLTEETKTALFEKFFAKFKKELDDFSFNMNDTKMSFSVELSKEAKEKITIVYEPKTYLRMKQLVQHYKTEVGWYGLVKKIDDKKYYVYDVLVPKQYVSGGKVDTDDDEIRDWKDMLTDDEINNMYFQAHSHVDFSTTASGTDLQNQADTVRNMGNRGFFIFQIWNKKNDINTYLYDIDNNLFYDRKDVVLEIEDGEGYLSDFAKATEAFVQEKKYYPYYNLKDTRDFKPKGKKENLYPTQYLNGYWDGMDYYGGDYN